MSTTIAVRIGAALALVSMLASAQTPLLYIHAGAGKIMEAPALETPALIQSMTMGPDGRIYIADYNERILRFDPATEAVTSLPETPGEPTVPNFRVELPAGVAILPDLTLLYGDHDQLFSFDTQSPSFPTWIRLLDQPLRMTYRASTDRLYVVATNAHRIYSLAGPTFQNTTLVAGTGTAGFSGDGGLATSAQLYRPADIAIAPNGDMYIADDVNHRIRRVSAAGVITTVVGTGQTSYNGEGLPPLQTNLFQPSSVALDAAGNVYFDDGNHYRIRRWNVASNTVTTVVGSGIWGYSGDGGHPLGARIGGAKQILFDGAGRLYFSDNSQRNIRRVDFAAQQITTVFGNGTRHWCGDGGPARASCLQGVVDIDVDSNGNVAIADFSNARIRRIDGATGIINTAFIVPSDGANSLPDHVALDHAGNIFYSGVDNRVYRVDGATGVRTLVAGNGQGHTYSGDGGPATAAGIAQPKDLTTDAAGNLYFIEGFNRVIRRVDAANGIISTYAGIPGAPLGTPHGDGGPATSAAFRSPTQIEFDAAGNLLIGDAQHCRLRKVDAQTGIITTIAGIDGCTTQNPGDGVSATQVPLGSGFRFTVNPDGDVLIAWSNRIRRIDADTGVIHTQFANVHDYSAANDHRMDWPFRMHANPSGDLLMTQATNSSVIYRLFTPQPVDSTPPEITIHINGILGNDGWYTSPVTVRHSVADPESATSVQGCGTRTFSTDAYHDAPCIATSEGGTANGSIVIPLDATPPQVSFAAPSPAANAAGWRNAPVSVPFLVEDAMSGAAGANAASPLSFANEGLALTTAVTATDRAGNATTLTSPPVNIDLTPPQLAVTTPAAGATVGAFSTVTAQFSCSDALSGSASCSGTVANGEPLPTGTPGARTFTATAADFAGNVSTTTRDYSVASLVFERFIEPLRRSPTFNGVTAGSLVPIRWRMLSAGQVVTNPAAFQSLTVLNLTCQGTPIPLNDTATGGPGLNVNPVNGYFTYNWQTDASWAGTCRRVQIRLGDNSVKEVVFRLQ